MGSNQPPQACRPKSLEANPPSTPPVIPTDQHTVLLEPAHPVTRPCPLLQEGFGIRGVRVRRQVWHTDVVQSQRVLRNAQL